MQLRDALAGLAFAAPLREGAANAEPANDDYLDQTSGFPEDARALIHCPPPSATQAGRRGVAEWVLEFEPRARPFVEPLMGWTGGSDPLSQVRLRFPTRDAAVTYARRQGLPYEIREPAYTRNDCAKSRQPLQELEAEMPLELAWAWDAPHLMLDGLVAANDTRRASA
jgi:hypothetical protein